MHRTHEQEVSNLLFWYRYCFLREQNHNQTFNMKKIFTFSAAAMIAFTMVSAVGMDSRMKMNAKDKAVVYQAETVKWNKTTHNFGTISMGPKADVIFKFTNTGNTPITIKSANPSCGCTISDFTRTPVLPGEKGEVKASYTTEGHPGNFQKTINVVFDNGTTQTLTIEGIVSTEPASGKGSELK